MSGTADVYTQATLSPSKLELLAPWLVQQSWFEGDAADLERVAFFRFVVRWWERPSWQLHRRKCRLLHWPDS